MSVLASFGEVANGRLKMSGRKRERPKEEVDEKEVPLSISLLWSRHEDHEDRFHTLMGS